MIDITGWDNLRPYGIHCLTGEACSLSMRLLCDVDQAGRGHLATFLGMPDLSLAPAWNGGAATGSIMLARTLFDDLAIWCHLTDHAAVVKRIFNPITQCRDDLLAYTAGEWANAYARLKDWHARGIGTYWLWQASEMPNAYGRNLHHFSGRTL